jgi:hypothetical protein
MEIKGKSILALGGSGEVGTAICRQLLRHQPAKIVIASIDGQAANTADTLAKESCSCGCSFESFTGNIFVRWELKEVSAADIVSSKDYTRCVVEDTFNELSEKILNNSTLYRLIAKTKPDIIIDCINTATALAYKNIYDAYEKNADWYHILLTATEPSLVRHIQILYKAMQSVNTRLYLKIGTTGTGGMGLNIPFTHGEESPSRLLMGKALAAGGQTSLLYLMSQTPGAPIIKEIKPATMIGWKNINQGVIRKSGRTYPLYNCNPDESCLLKEGETFSYDDIEKQGYSMKKDIEGTFVDVGENGYFSPLEFEIITSNGLMEYITPEDITSQVIGEIIGINSSCDVLSAIDGSVMKSTYRAGLLRNDAIKKANTFVSDNITYGFLGPRISKLIAECVLLQRQYGSVNDVLSKSPEHIAASLEELVIMNPAIRANFISIGLPILFADGLRILFAKRATKDKVWEEKPWVVTQKNIDYFADLGWVDLRTSNILQWQKRIRTVYYDNDCTQPLDIGKIVSWILINECDGGRIGECNWIDI